MSSVYLTVYAETDENRNRLSIDADIVITEKFVAESEYSISTDSNGEPIIVLSHVEPLYAGRSSNVQYAKTIVAVLPETPQCANEIVESINELQRASGSYTEDGWFYGDSVYLTSTIYYANSTIDGITYGSISNVTIGCSVNSGTTISSMSLLMGQNGWAPGGYKTQRTTFNATTARAFSPPSGWVSVQWDSSVSDVGAHLTATATRASGQSTFTLYNTVL